jgi:hypothetical protein
MIDPNRPHFHVMVTEDEEIRTFRSAAEARQHREALRHEGKHAFVEPCGGNCPLLYHRPYDTGPRKETHA